MPRLAYVDGRVVPLSDAHVSVEDRGLQFADSAYEVVAVLNGRPLDWDGHAARLGRTLAALSIDLPIDPAALAIVARRLIAANRATEALLYIQVTRGSARRDHAFPATVRPSLMMTVRPFDFAQRVGQQASGVGVVTVADARWGRCDLKTTGLLANVLAKQAARDAGAFEAWLVGSDGTVAEGASTNAWIVDTGTLVTPPLTPRVLPGVMRAAVIDTARSLQIRVAERDFTVADARGASEALITSTTVPVLPVVAIDGVPVGTGRPGPVAARLAGAVWAAIAAQTGYRP